MNFLKTLLAVLVGLAIYTGIMFFLFFVFVSFASKEEAVTVSDNSVLRLKLARPISERDYSDPFENIPIFPGVVTSSIGLIELKSAIQKAKTDSRIKGIYIEAPYTISGLAKVQEIREALEDFRESGKFVIAYSEFLTELGYYISSAADEVYLNPAGIFEFNGLSVEILFFKEMLQKLEIDPLIFRVGQYKSAVEPFIRNDMSEENREQYLSFINSIYDQMIGEMGNSRKIEPSTLRRMSDNVEVRNPEDAKEKGLVDDLLYEDQVLNKITGKLGLAENANINFISYKSYNKSYKSKYSSNRIAVIVATGDIVMGKSDENMISSDVFAKDIREARENSRIKAIVLRINSPGGNYIASDVIWHEIVEAAKVKPVIASMSDYAASGGYYLAMACDTIIADPITVTGSIGIFRIQFTMQDFLKNKLGITSDRVGTGKYSDMNSIFRPMSDAEKQMIQAEVDKGYETFVRKAAEGRGMSEDDIKKIAAGRVWTGLQAKENGLVDILGTYEDAIALAAEKAGIKDDYALTFYPEQKTFLEQLFTEMSSEAKVKHMKEEMGILYPYFEQLKNLENLQGTQARLPVDIKIY